MKPEYEKLYFEASRVFSPSAPIDQRSLFAGRIKQLSTLLDTVVARGQHAVVYGERGVGKTSLVSVLPALLDHAVVIRENCHSQDTFGRIWARAFQNVTFTVEKRLIGFDAQTRKAVLSLANQVPADPTPDDVVSTLRQLKSRIVFVFDEFDQVKNAELEKSFADVIKALSDHATPSKIVIVGVGDSVDALIRAHASVERAIRQIRMPRMDRAELVEILDKAFAALKMSCDPAARDRAVALSQGLPTYVHNIGLHSTRDALENDTANVTLANVDAGIRAAVEQAQQSLLDAYLAAVSSPRKEALFKHILVACALAKTDELAFFTPASVKAPLAALGRPLEIPAFASHLNKFASPERGDILEKRGTQRKFRYRFKNPLLEPFVVLRGISESLVDIQKVEKLLSQPRETLR